MSHSLSKLFIHIVFHIKRGHPMIRKVDKNELCAYIASVIKDNQSIPIIINGVENHIHILCVMSRNIALAKLVEEIKRHSSRWIKSKGIHYQNFAWQGGYAAFSISHSIHQITKRYIANQEAHHKKKSFEEEYLKYLKEHEIDYDEKYLWSD